MQTDALLPQPGARQPDRTAFLADRLPRLLTRWQQGEIADAHYAAAYFLIWRIATHGRRFASRRTKTAARPDSDAWLAELCSAPAASLHASLISWFQSYQFFGVISQVPLAIVGWLRDSWPLQLTLGVPSPTTVLKMQAAGTRPVTVISAIPRALQPVLTQPDGCAFLIHDLEHAWKFLHDPALHAAQQRLFQLLSTAMDSGLFDDYLAEPEFASRFDYLISDMNTHPVHGLRYLAAVLIECRLRLEGKTSRDTLSGSGEVALAGLLERLGQQWGFGEAARAALAALLNGRFHHPEALALEQALSISTISARRRETVSSCIRSL